MKLTYKIILTILFVVAGSSWVKLAGSDRQTVPASLLNKLDVIKLKGGKVREVTAYNVGDPAQTDDTPCIGASNLNLCEALEAGKRVCASNAYPMYSIIYIEGYGECEILDRMNKKYNKRVDIAFKKSEKIKALIWGKQTRKVYLIK